MLDRFGTEGKMGKGWMDSRVQGGTMPTRALDTLHHQEAKRQETTTYPFLAGGLGLKNTGSDDVPVVETSGDSGFNLSCH